MPPHMDMKMNGSKQHVVLGLLLLVLSVGYTSGSVMSSSSMLAAQQGQENVTQEQVQLECDVEGASLNVDCNVCYCLNGQFSCSYKLCFTNSESKGPLETDTESPQNSTKAYEDPDIKEDTDYDDPNYQEVQEYQKCVEGTRWTKECNICECSFGQELCTMKTCLPECVHGSFWVDDCNNCKCYEGEVECTTRKCFSATTCAEGSSWTEDCNTCFCSNGITSCSKEICLSEGDDTTTQLNTKENNTSEFAGNNVMRGAAGPNSNLVTNIKIPSELNFCIYTVNGQQEYFPFIPKCNKAGKLACAYCEDEAFPKYNPRTCKCHKKSRFRGSKG